MVTMLPQLYGYTPTPGTVTCPPTPAAVVRFSIKGEKLALMVASDPLHFTDVLEVPALMKLAEPDSTVHPENALQASAEASIGTYDLLTQGKSPSPGIITEPPVELVIVIIVVSDSSTPIALQLATNTNNNVVIVNDNLDIRYSSQPIRYTNILNTITLLYPKILHPRPVRRIPGRHAIHLVLLG